MSKVPKRPSLSTVVADSLLEQIVSGALAPGVQLPTETELCDQFGVSRTVVREAIARLRYDGLVIPQQGRGVFVSEAPPSTSFSISREDLSSLPETIALLELRLGVEVEAAGLCAERRTSAEAKRIREMLENIKSGPEQPSKVQIHYDYDFHLTIAKGSKNEFIHQFLVYLRPMIVPRFQLGHVVAQDFMDGYFQRIHSEHEMIVAEIEKQNPAAARQAMHDHLQNSLERVKALGRTSGIISTETSLNLDERAVSLFRDLGTLNRQ